MRKWLKNNSEVCKVWAAQSQSYGRTKHLNFDGDTLYSYGYYPIAKILSEKLALATNNVYSATTARHIDEACYALRKNKYKVLAVANIEPDDEANCADFKDRLRIAAGRFWRSQLKTNWYYDSYFELVGSYQEYLQTFNLPTPAFLGCELRGEFARKHLAGLPERKQKADELRQEQATRYWGRVFVTPKWLFYKEPLEPKDILKIKNAQVRAEFVKRVGIDRIIYELGEIVDNNGKYQLILLNLGDGRKRPYLKMQNPSVPELWHVEGVHPACKTIEHALMYRRYGNEILGGWMRNPDDRTILESNEYENWKPEKLT